MWDLEKDLKDLEYYRKYFDTVYWKNPVLFKKKIGIILLIIFSDLYICIHSFIKKNMLHPYKKPRFAK